MTERPTDAFPLKSQVHRGEARDDADRASLDATLKGLGYMAATRPGNADRESALRRVAWQVTNRNYEGLTPGSDLHKRLSEFATAKLVEHRMAASDGSIVAAKMDSRPVAAEAAPDSHATAHKAVFRPGTSDEPQATRISAAARKSGEPALKLPTIDQSHGENLPPLFIT